MSESVLDGFRVVETAGLSAELAGRLLADLGAEVIKVEAPEGAPTRRISPAFFAYYNAGKQSLVADARRLADLLAGADVWIDSTHPSERRPAVSNPRLVIARVTPFGLDGPHAAYRASDLVSQAAGGMAFTNGYPNEAPLPGFGLQAYHAASLHAVIGILLALYERERSGLGQTIDCSVQEAVVSSLEQTTSAWNSERRIETRRGPLHWTQVFRTCRCRDGHVLVSLVCDWTTLVGWLAERDHGAELAGDEWQEFVYRRDHADQAFAALERWAAELDAEEILAGAQLRRIPFAAVRSPARLAEDPQLVAREFFSTIPGTKLVFPGPPFRMSRTPLRTRSGPPVLGDADLFPSPRWGEGQGEGEAPRRRALEGIRVLDFTHVVAGPIATRILADHGADVVKIERLKTLDLWQRRGGLFGNLNRGKRSLILNLSDPRGVALARRLAAKSDVVIDNFSARVMPGLGLDYASLKPLREDIITVGMSGFGTTGPCKDFVSFGPTLHALSGHTWLMRPEGKDPAGWGFSHSDVCGGLNGAIAVIAALLHRARTGEGQAIELAQLESVVSLMGPMLVDVANGRGAPSPPLDRSQEAPALLHGIYRATGDDRWVAIAVFEEVERRRLAEIAGDDVEAWTARRTPEEVTEICQRAGIAAFTVANGEDLGARDAHLEARGYWAKVETPEGEPIALDGVAVRLSRTPGRVDRPGPLHGEHGAEVLREVLGLTADEIEDLGSVTRAAAAPDDGARRRF